MHRLSFFVLLIAGCSQPHEQVQLPMDASAVNHRIQRVNMELINEDNHHIVSYFERRNWPYKATGSGLYYYIYHQGGGKMAVSGSDVAISYSISLLDGTSCYGGDKPVDKTIVAGMGKEVSGLEEGILLMREGDKAILIIPPHLAHGLLGDDERIPARSTIVYNISLVKVSQTK
jgi:FKBP-type peptidyl-prolyl cis-trans isomerases 1